MLAFAAPSGTGKTTLITRVVEELVGRGVRVGVLKADAHRVVLDTPGKDSWRFAEAGASPVAVLSAERLALFERLDGDVTLAAAAARLFPSVDVLLAEGFRSSGLPTIRVHRALGPTQEGWSAPRNTVAWASDCAVETHLPVLPLNHPKAVADWLAARFIARTERQKPTVVCAVTDPLRLEEAVTAARRIGLGLGCAAMVVVGPAVSTRPRAGLCMVSDLRPSRGALGALFTALAAAETTEVLWVGTRHWHTPITRLAGLMDATAAAGEGADVACAVVDGRPEPELGLYGYRCLSAIQQAFLSGEEQMTSWWGQVRTTGPGTVAPSTRPTSSYTR